MKTEPLTQSQRNRKAEARSMQERGAVRMPGGMLPADAAVALDDLLNSGYGGSKAGVIARALLEAQKNHSS